MVAQLFSSALQRARERNLPVMELLSVAGHLSAAGEVAAVSELYRTWLEFNSDVPLVYAIYFNYAVVLSNANDLEGARNALNAAIARNPDFLPPYINLGHVLERMGLTGDAVTQWYTVVNKLPAITGEALGFKTAALKQLGRVLERSNLDVHAEDALRHSLDLDPNQSDVIQHWVSLRQRQCKWPVIKPWGNVTREKLVDGISSLSLAAHTDDPLLLLANAFLFAKVDIGRPKESFVDTHRGLIHSASRRRRIGYLSSDLREHAVGFLTAELYGLHDREKVEVFLYYCGIPASDETRARIKDSAEHWIDISAMTDEAAAKHIADDKIEILVDLNGYTNGARSKMLAMRPAPIIVNWLGYPGTMGSPYHHYIIADSFIIPEGDELYYSEKVLRLPCYQPNDRKRAISKHRPTRQEAGLPEDAMVYCCFNGLHKINSFTWKRWMTVLAQVPGSVLWLLEGIDTTNARLTELAVQQGIAPERIIFAPKKRNPEHLARYPLADLFLDTSPYGAHTTSSDALWMGVPVLTLVGRSFASRVCGSLIMSAGMGDMICRTSDEFVARAIELGLNQEKRLDYRRRLQANRDTCTLFDTPLLVSRLEELYDQMWQEYKNGNLPRPDLSNLDVYNEIGIELDNEEVELLAAPNYREIYEQKLAEKDAFAFLRPDCRLWTEETARRLRKL